MPLLECMSHGLRLKLLHFKTTGALGQAHWRFQIQRSPGWHQPGGSPTAPFATRELSIAASEVQHIPHWCLIRRNSSCLYLTLPVSLVVFQPQEELPVREPACPSVMRLHLAQQAAVLHEPSCLPPHLIVRTRPQLNASAWLTASAGVHGESQVENIQPMFTAAQREGKELPTRLLLHVL